MHLNSTGSKARPQVLVVDDEAAVRKAIEMALRQEPFDVLCASGAMEAISMLRSKTVDLMICDHRMPVMTGVELLRKVRAAYPEMKLILLTGHADLDTAIEAINECRIFKLLTKPWNHLDLLSTVRQALAEQRAEKSATLQKE